MLRILTLLGILMTFNLFGQNSYYLLISSSKPEMYSENKIRKFDNQSEITTYLEKQKSKLIKKGHVLASIDSIQWQGDTAVVEFYMGEQFKTIQIDYDEENRYLIRKTPRLSERLIAKLPFTPEMVDQTLTSISRHLNSTGYPFSKVYLKMDEIQPNLSTAFLHVERGSLVTIKEIHIKGESKVNEKFIQSAISIKEGDIYNIQNLQNISSKIEQVQFIKEIRPYEILFTPEGAELFLYLEGTPVSSINGIVGLQPNELTGKTTVTGEVRLKLLNIIKRGEQLQLEWRSLQPKTQELKVDFNFPFLFKTPFGIDAKFNLYKLDSTYLQTNFTVGVRYFFSGSSYLKAFYERDNSDILSGGQNSLNPNLSTTSTNSYGLAYTKNQVDYLPNPSKGLNISAQLSAGRRKSQPNLNDSSTVSTTFKGRFEIEAFIPIFPRHILRLANRTSSYYAPDIYQNELFRFGGLNSQRGFNEETLLATTMTTFSVEYRFLVDRNSHAFLFFDQSIYESNENEYIQDTPFGFGVGYSFGSKIGIFSISYALGKQFDNPIKMKDGKVHFGYIAYF